jgi:hypothetical protein
MLRCLLRHATVIVEGCTIALIGCVRCGHVEHVWLVVRPEIANRAAGAEQQAASERRRFLREREQRAQQMGNVRQFKRVR